jgi:hypothetical protein
MCRRFIQQHSITSSLGVGGCWGRGLRWVGGRRRQEEEREEAEGRRRQAEAGGCTRGSRKQQWGGASWGGGWGELRGARGEGRRMAHGTEGHERQRWRGERGASWGPGGWGWQAGGDCACLSDLNQLSQGLGGVRVCMGLEAG